MKSFLTVSIFVWLTLFAAACPEAKNLSASSNIADAAAPSSDDDNAAHKKSDDSAEQIAVFDLLLSPFEKNQKAVVEEVSEFYGAAKIEAGAEFDIVNEYGFLGKGKFKSYVKPSKNERGHWLIEIRKNRVRPDLEELSSRRMQEMEKEYPLLPAYGIFPSKPERKKIKTSQGVDLSENGMSERQTIFLSLPKPVRDGVDVYNKAEQNLEYPNRWADLDSDGKIDFVYIRIRCEENPHSHCGKYLSLFNGRWTELPENRL